MRIVMDTNVFVSGIFWEGNFCSQLIEKWKNKKFELVKTLKDFKIQMHDATIKDWRSLFIENFIIVEPTIKLDVVKDDPQCYSNHVRRGCSV